MLFRNEKIQRKEVLTLVVLMTEVVIEIDVIPSLDGATLSMSPDIATPFP